GFALGRHAHRGGKDSTGAAHACQRSRSRGAMIWRGPDAAGRLPPLVARAAASVEIQMNYRSLGASGLKVSELSLGSWTTFGGSVASGDAGPIVSRAFELGVNLFDTADVYVKGGAERALGASIRDLPRGEIVVATKCMGRVGEGPLGRGLSRKHIFDALDASLRRLGVDYIDLYQFHAPDADTPIEESLR